MRGTRLAVERARRLRKNFTDAEILLWHFLRRRGLRGLKFRRRYPIGGYVLDFFCSESGLAVEIDGGGHAQHAKSCRDVERTASLERFGIRVLRFWNTDVLLNMDGVLRKILKEVTPSP